jgi:L-lactate dehydrogenase complex protein LldG
VNVPDERDARSAILERVRAANRGAALLEQAARDWEQIPRTYRAAAGRPHEAVLELLMDRLRDYDAEVERLCSSAVSAAVERILAARGKPRLLVAAGLPAEFLPGSPISVDDNFAPHELDAFDAILTGATLAIAETGTLVLQNTPGQGRRAATLVPDFHVCVLRVADVVETVPQAIRRLAGTATLPTTFVSGPSATADIEMTRIKGVHGPRFLHVLLVD